MELASKSLFAGTALFALVFAVTPAGVAANAGEQDYLFVGEDNQGNLVTFTVRPSEVDDILSCGGVSPGTQTCQNVHTHALVSHGFVLVTPAYTGLLNSRISDGSNTRIFNCVLNSNSIVACNGQGTFPAGPTTQDCAAAGAGGWLCRSF